MIYGFPILRLTEFIQIYSRKPQIYGSSSFVIHITYYDNVDKFPKKNVMCENGHETKNLEFSLDTPSPPQMKAMFICEANLANVVRLSSFLYNKNIS